MVKPSLVPTTVRCVMHWVGGLREKEYSVASLKELTSCKLDCPANSQLTFDNPNEPHQSGQFSEDMIPTVGFNMRKVTKGNVTIKVSATLRFGPKHCL